MISVKRQQTDGGRTQSARVRVVAATVLVLLATAGTVNAVDPGECLTADEAALLDMVNQYRSANGLSPVPFSRSQSEVAQWHVWDLALNNPHAPPQCNLHSWSDQNMGLWTEVCYTSDHAEAQKMWDKPSEISGGVYSAYGYEIAAFSTQDITPAEALAAWQGSPGHNAVILNLGAWASRDPWPAMGAGMRGEFAVVWFGDSADPRGTILACSVVQIFEHGFEGGGFAGWSQIVQ